MISIPAPLLTLLRRMFGNGRAEALAAKARMRSIIRGDRRAFEEAAIKARAVVGELVEPGEVVAEAIAGEDRVKRAAGRLIPSRRR